MLQVKNQYNKVYIEFLRIMAAFFVIINHVYNPMFFYPTISKTWYVCISLFFTSKVAVPIFLMISGSLLLVKTDSKEKYKSRIFRWISVIIVFSTVYYIYSLKDGSGGVKIFLQKVFGGATIAYWYLYLYLGILFMLPILQKVAGILTKKQLQLFLLLTLVVGGGFPILSTFSEIKISNEFLNVLFSPYLGMLFCGYYIEKYVYITKRKALISGIVFVILNILQVMITAYLYHLDNQNYMQMDNRIFFTISLSAICVYIIVKYFFEHMKLPQGVNKIIVFGGRLTFGVFLLSDLFINFFYPYLEVYLGSVNIFVLLFVYSIFLYLCGSICTMILKIIPGLKRLL